MAERVPLEAYYPTGQFLEAERQGMQLGLARRQAQLQSDQMAAEMATYGVSTPRDLMFAKMQEKKNLERVENFRDFAIGAGEIQDTYGGTEEGEKIIDAYINAHKDTWSPFLADFSVRKAPKEDIADRIETTTPLNDIEVEIGGQPVKLKGGTTYEIGLKGQDGLWFRPMIPSEEMAGKKEGKETEKTGKLLQRRSAIQKSIASLHAGGGLDTMTLAFMSPENIKAMQSMVKEGNFDAAINALNDELQFVESQLPETYRKKEEPVTEPDDVSSQVSNFISSVLNK